MRSPRYLPVLVLAILPFIWGYSWVPNKLGIMESSPFVFAALRCLPAGLLLLVIMMVIGRPLRPKAVALTAIVGVLQLGAFTAFTATALVTGGAGHTAMLANTWQFWLLPVAWVFLGERMRGSQWIAVGLGLVGLVLIIEPWKLHGVLSSFLTLIGAVCFAAGATVAKVVRRRRDVDLLSFAAWSTFFGSIPLAILAVFVPGGGIHWSTTFIWSLTYTILISTALSSLLWLYVLGAMPANIAGLGTIGTPVVGVLASWLQLSEELSPWEIVGMVSVVAGLTLLALWGVRATRQERTAESTFTQEPPLSRSSRT